MTLSSTSDVVRVDEGSVAGDAEAEPGRQENRSPPLVAFTLGWENSRQNQTERSQTLDSVRA
jgi:hypothetical protein